MNSFGRVVTFAATLCLALNSETGEEYLIRTEKELDEEARLALADYDQQLAARKYEGEGEAGLARLRTQFLAQQKVHLAKVISDADTMRPLAEVWSFTLTKPGYGDLDRIREEANEYDSGSGNTRWNEAKFRRLLLENNGVRQDGRYLTQQDIANLPPVIALELGARLARAISLDQRRLILTVPTPVSIDC